MLTLPVALVFLPRYPALIFASCYTPDWIIPLVTQTLDVMLPGGTEDTHEVVCMQDHGHVQEVVLLLESLQPAVAAGNVNVQVRSWLT